MHEREVLFLKLMRYLKEREVADSAIDYWIAILTDDLVLLKRVFPFVENPHVTEGEVIQKHLDHLRRGEILEVLARWMFLAYRPEETFNA